MQNSASLDTYLANDGFKAFLKAREMTPEQIIDEVKASALRGRGGAGFPTGLKWSFVPRTSPKPKYIIINADESEPGTCKDRLLMEYDPHQMIEGILIAGLRGRRAQRLHLYSRRVSLPDRSHGSRHRRSLFERGYLGKTSQGTGFDFDLYTHSGAGAYECGEETALLDSHRRQARHPAHEASVSGGSRRCGIPTLLNNVETFSAVPAIIRDGGAAFAALGTPKNGGTRLVCISGHVNKPGVYELPLGYHMMKASTRSRGGIPAEETQGRGSRRIFMPALEGRECDIPMDYDTLAKVGSMLGSGGMVVMDEDTDMVKSRCGSCDSMRMKAAAGASRAVKAPPGCSKFCTRIEKAADGKRMSRCSASSRRTCSAGRSARWAMQRRCRPFPSSRNSREDFEDHLTQPL